MPFMKFVVPSIGSITQKFSLSSFLIKPLSSVKKEYFFFDLDSSLTNISSTFLSEFVTKFFGPFTET